MKPKKKITLMLCTVLIAGMFAVGCSGGEPSQSSENQQAGGAAQAGESGFGALKSFQARTLEGDVFTQEDLAEKDVTAINFWSLTCGPCIVEMPDIAAFAKSLPDCAGMITVCLDGSMDAESAKAILKDAGYEGITLVSGDGDFQNMCDAVQYTPTTIIVDQEGNAVGEAIIGGQEDLAGVYTDAMNKALKAMGKAELENGEN